MARIQNSSYYQRTDYGSSSSGTPNSRPSIQTDNSPNVYDYFPGKLGPTARAVVESLAFKQAYELFSKESDKTWLSRLLAIPNSVQDATNTWVDDLGLSNSYNDKQDANYQYCLEQINALLSEYHSWKNSLPVTQANQLAQIGVNSAITGQGLSGSEIPNVGVSSNPSSISSANPVEAFNAIGTFLMSGVNGFVDIATKFANLRLTKQKTLFDMAFTEKSFLRDINKYARDNGISFNKPLKSFSDFDDLVITDSEKTAIETRTFFESALDTDFYRPLLTAMKYENGSISDFLKGYVNGAPYFGNTYGSSPSAVTEVVKNQYELFKFQKQLSLENNKHNNEILKFSAESEEYKSLSAKHQAKIDELNKKKSELFDDTVNRLYELAQQGDMDATLLLCKILTSYNYSDIDILKNNAAISESDANFRDAQNSIGIASDVLDTATGFVK